MGKWQAGDRWTMTVGGGVDDLTAGSQRRRGGDVEVFLPQGDSMGCYARAAWNARGRNVSELMATRIENNKPRVAVFLPTWIGDSCMATPALRALRTGFPTAHILGVVRPVVRDLLRAPPDGDERPYVDEFLVYNKTLRGRCSLVRHLRQQECDIAVLFTNSWWTAAAASLAGIRTRVGYATDGRGWLLTDRLRPPSCQASPVAYIDYLLSICQYLGCPVEDRRMALGVETDFRNQVDEFLRECRFDARRPLIVLNNGSATQLERVWPTDRVRELAYRLATEREANVLLHCGPGDRRRSMQVAQEANHPRVVSMGVLGELPIGLSKAVLERAAVVVSTDSGPRHMAIALDRPLVTLCGATDPALTKTYNVPERILDGKVSPCPRTNRLHHRGGGRRYGTHYGRASVRGRGSGDGKPRRRGESCCLTGHRFPGHELVPIRGYLRDGKRMKVTGFTIVRNAVRYDYPVVESIRSLLPLVDDMVVAVGDCADGTRELVAAIADPKIRIIDTEWDDSLRSGGRVLAEQTNLAMRYCDGDWLAYLQADEVLHERDLPRIRRAMEWCWPVRAVEGLSFRYHHFRADYAIRDPLPYRRQVRIIRNHIGVESYGDACGFRIRGRKLRSLPTGAWVYHYGYVRPPQQMAAKMDYFLSLYDGRQVMPGAEATAAQYAWDLATCEPFRGDHPRVMHDRIARKDWETPPVKLGSRWRNHRYWKGLIHKNTRTLRRWARTAMGGA
ncbi:MAG: hypothetical protein KatS3mg111_3577 [Pirellulaceae bacterium]|nr:MAG: hypothetical protein KatS3mg111_3577 [Pirellulaceae bacterium]